METAALNARLMNVVQTLGLEMWHHVGWSAAEKEILELPKRIQAIAIRLARHQHQAAKRLLSVAQNFKTSLVVVRLKSYSFENRILAVADSDGHSNYGDRLPRHVCDEGGGGGDLISTV